MTQKKLISIETTRYSEFFRRLFEEYKTEKTCIAIDGELFDATQFPQLISDWCINNQIKKTKNFKLSQGKVDLFGFHDSPDGLWAAETELPFVKRLATDKLVRFRIANLRK